MTPREKWQHAAAAWSLLRRAQDANATQGTQLCELAAHRLRQAGDLGLAQQIDDMLEAWFPADSELQTILDRAAAYAAQCETECLTGENAR